jgi:hypothetical protein
MTLEDWLKLDYKDEPTRNAFSDWCEETGLVFEYKGGKEPAHWTAKPIHGKLIRATSRMRACKQVRKIARLSERSHTLRNYKNVED